MPRHRTDTGNDGSVHHCVPQVVVVDPHFEHYKPLAVSARLGKLDLHFRSSGAEAIKFARRRHVDAWLVAAELDDMSGHDFVELLRAKLNDSTTGMFAPPDARVAMVGDGSRAVMARVQEAIEAGADAVVSQPITFRDLEDLLEMASLERMVPHHASRSGHALVTLPVGVGAAIVAIAVLMMS